MKKDLVTVKLWSGTRKGLKVLAAERGVPMTALVDYLLVKEIQSAQSKTVERVIEI